MIELTPAMVLDQSKTFKYGYRNVLVLKKMTFPNDKVLSIEISEKQISGKNHQSGYRLRRCSVCRLIQLILNDGGIRR